MAIKLPDNPTDDQLRSIVLVILRETFEPDVDEVGDIEAIDNGWRTTYRADGEQFNIQYQNGEFTKFPASGEFGEDLEEWEYAEADPDELDEVYAKYRQTVNMSATELKKWAETEASKLASLDRSPINRNLELLTTPKDKWTAKHIRWANRTISFVSRMKGSGGSGKGQPVRSDVPYSAKQISLRNWAYKFEELEPEFTEDDLIDNAEWDAIAEAASSSGVIKAAMAAIAVAADIEVSPEDFDELFDENKIKRDQLGRFATKARGAIPVAAKVGGGTIGAAVGRAMGERLGGSVGAEVGSIAGKVAGDAVGRVTGTTISAALTAKERLDRDNALEGMSAIAAMKKIGAETISDMQKPEFKEKLKQALLSDIEGTGVGKIAATAIKAIVPDIDLPAMILDLDSVANRSTATGGAIATATAVSKAREKIRGK